MLFIGVAFVSIAVVVVARMWGPGLMDPADLGWMSQQWLAEHRASHSR